MGNGLLRVVFPSHRFWAVFTENLWPWTLFFNCISEYKEMQFVDLWMQSTGTAIYYLLSYFSKIVRTKEIWIKNYFMVHLFLRFIFFPVVIHSCPLCQHLLQCKDHWKPSRDSLVQPCHSGFHLLSHKIWFNWEQPCITLIFPVSVLPACCMGVCA